jgi:hypothetical protein
MDGQGFQMFGVVVSAKPHQVVIAHKDLRSKLSFMPQLSTKHLLTGAAIVLCGLWSGIPAVNCQTLQASTREAVPNANSRPILVELFTSEGCSSCPPADEFVQKIDSLQPVAGAQLIVLSEHVDYWDHDGWKDPNSSAALTERQGAYERALRLSTPYTPQIIVDGASEIRIGNPQQMEETFQRAVAVPKIPVRISAVTLDSANQGTLRTHIEADASSDNHGGDIYLAIALNHVESQVLHGENGGKRLTHIAVVQQLAKIGKLQKGKSFADDVQLKLKAGTDPKNIRLVAFVQTSGPGKLLGATLWRPLP